MKTRSTEPVALKLIKSNDTFHSNPKLILQEEINLIAVTKHEVTISNFNITDRTKTFEIYTPKFWQDKDTKKTKRV